MVRRSLQEVSQRLVRALRRPLVVGEGKLNSTSATLASRGSLVSVALGFSLWMLKPVGDTWLTAFSYLLVLAAAALGALAHGAFIDYRIKLSFLGAVVVGVVGYAIGMSNGYTGAAPEFVFFVALPVLWAFFVGGLGTGAVRWVINAIPIASIVLSLIGLLYWIGRVADSAAFDWFSIFGLGLGVWDQGYGWGMTYYPISTLLFVVPFLFISIVVPGTYSWRPSKWAAGPALGLAAGLMLVSGRRALFISLALSIIVGAVALFAGRTQRKIRRRLYVVGLVAIVGGVALSVLSRFSIAQMAGSLISEEMSGDSVRGRTTSALIASWLQAPVFGHGLGAELRDFVRLDDGNLWAFEVQYHLVLNALGLVGLLVLGAGTALLLVLSVRAYKTDPETYPFLASLVVGTVAALIANATNPYLHTPGHYWMLFLLVMGANGYLRDRHSKAIQVEEDPTRVGVNAEE